MSRIAARAIDFSRVNEIRGDKDQAQIDTVHVFSWSDKDYDREKEFTNVDKDLAKNRADTIKDDLGVNSVELVNIAAQPNWLQSTLGLQDILFKREW